MNAKVDIGQKQLDRQAIHLGEKLALKKNS